MTADEGEGGRTGARGWEGSVDDDSEEKEEKERGCEKCKQSLERKRERHTHTGGGLLTPDRSPDNDDDWSCGDEEQRVREAEKSTGE